MKNKGNQKHLTFEQRVDIERGLTENRSFTEIGRIIGKNPSTISKEVRLPNEQIKKNFMCNALRMHDFNSNGNTDYCFC